MCTVCAFAYDLFAAQWGGGDNLMAKIINELEQLSSQDDAPQLVSSLLKKFDVVTGLSAWSDPKQTH